MTIEYKDSKRIVALSYDNALNTATFEDDFSGADNWTPDGDNVVVNTSTDVIDWDVIDEGNEDGLSYDLTTLTTVSDSKWVAEFDITYDTVTSANNTNGNYLLVCLDSVITPANTVGHDALGVAFEIDNTPSNQATIGAFSCDNLNLYDSMEFNTPTGTISLFTETAQASETHYVRMIRDGATFTVEIYSDSTRQTLVESQSVDANDNGTVSGLRYFRIATTRDNVNGHTFDGTIDNVKFYNGVSSVNKPTDVQDNSILVEKDTANRYWFDGRGADTTTTNSNVNDVAHFENGTSANGVIGEKITSGNALIGKVITSISFWLYKLNSGSSGSETFTFGIWNSSGALQKEYGSVTRGQISQGSAHGDATKHTKTDSDGYVLQEDDIIGIRTNSAPSGWTVEVTQRDSDVYSNGQRAIFVQGSTPALTGKDIGFEVVSATPATWTWDNLISGFAGTWDKSPSDSQFEVSGGKLNFLENASSGGDRTWYDLGTNVSETKWLLRVRLRFTTIATQSAYPEIDLGISDNHANSDTDQDFIGCRILPMAANNLFRPRKCIDGSGTDAGKPRRGSAANHNPSPAFTTGKDYYIEFKRTSATNWSASLSDTDAYDGDIYSGSFTTATTALDGLRYFTVMDGTTATSGNMEGYIDVFEFYNGVTSPP